MVVGKRSNSQTFVSSNVLSVHSVYISGLFSTPKKLTQHKNKNYSVIIDILTRSEKIKQKKKTIA